MTEPFRARSAQDVRFWQDDALMQRFFEALPVAVASYDRNLVFDWANPAYCRWVQRPADQIVGHRFFEVFPGTEPTVGVVLQEVLDTGEAYHHNRFCFTFESEAGPDQTFWDVTHLARFDAAGEVSGILTMAMNLTSEVNLQQEVLRHTLALQESESQYRGLFEESALGIALVDLEGRLQKTNQAWRAMLGLSGPEGRGHALDEFLEPADLTFASLMQGLATDPGRLYDVRLRPARSGPLYGRLSASVHRDFRGAPRFVTCMVENVTELKAAEAARFQAHAELENFMRTVPDILYVLDPDGRLVRWNPPLETVTGRSAEELAGCPALDLFAPEDQPEVAAAIARAYAEGYADTEGRLIGPAGAIPYQFTAVPLKDAQGQVIGLTGMGRNITEIQRRDALMRTQVSRLQELNRLKTDFVHTVTHELRTPLTSILGYAEFLGDEFGGPLSEEQRRFVRQIEMGSRRLDYLINDLLDSARLEAETFHLNCEPADLAAKIQEVLDSLQPQLSGARIHLELDLPAGPLEAVLDPQRVGQVLFNLLSNALKFSAPASTVRIMARRAADSLCVQVQDQGPGIAPEDRSKLFQRFSQLEAGKLKRGTGLGLAISRAIVEAHGGEIGVDSEPGQGSTFWFSLPRAPASSPA